MMQSELNEKDLREIWDYYFKHRQFSSITYEGLQKIDTEFWALFNSGFKDGKDGPDKD